MATSARTANASASSQVPDTSPSQEPAFNFFTQAPPELLALIAEFALNAFDVERAENTARWAFEFYNEDSYAECTRNEMHRNELYAGDIRWSELVFKYVYFEVEQCITSTDVYGDPVELDPDLGSDGDQDRLPPDVAGPIANKLAVVWAWEARDDALQGLDDHVRQMTYYGADEFEHPHWSLTGKEATIHAENWHAAKTLYDALSLRKMRQMALAYAAENGFEDPEWLQELEPEDFEENENDATEFPPAVLEEPWWASCDW